MRNAGFTMIELVVVITVMAILAIGTVKFIGDSSDGYASTVRRTELGSTARLATERVTRELRAALPNSVRVSGACLEFVPVDTGTTYLGIPTSIAVSAFEVAAPVDGGLAGARVAVFPDSPAAVYALGNPGVISPVATFGAPDANGVVRVTLASAHRFPAESPSKRLFVVETPVSYCLDANRLWRYQGYGFAAVQPTTATLPTTMPGRSLIGDGVESTAPFSFSGATLTRNAEVAVDLTFRDDPDTLRIDHVVQLRNVP